MSNFVYVDNAATTKIKPQVLEKMMPYLSEIYANPSSIYSFSHNAKLAIEDAREKVANSIGADKKEIIFTSGATESDNWAIKGIAYAYKNKGNHIISTKIEHHAVMHTLEFLEKEGFEVTYLDVSETGLVDPKDFEAAIKENTILATIIFANNEIGTIEPIEQLATIAKNNNVIFHTDAVQAISNVEIDVHKMNIDLLSLTAHKINGPKGVGALYARKGLKLFPFIHGGAQENKRRAGTENVAGIVGLGEAIYLATKNSKEKIEKVTMLRDKLIEGIEKEIPYIRLNGDRENRLCNNVNFSFRFIEGEALLLMLDMKGICASSGSACTSGSLDPSHVLLSIGLPHEIAHGSLRLSLSEENTLEEIEYIISSLKVIVDRLRQMSPLYEDFERSGK